MYERRPLNTVTLTPPDYQINPEVLRDSYIEKEVRVRTIYVITGLPLFSFKEIQLEMNLKY